MNGRRIRIAAPWFLLAALATALLSDRFCLDWPREGVASAERKVSRRLLRRQVAFLSTFDEPGAYDWVSRQHALVSGTDAVPGRSGWAREFPGTRWCTIQFPIDWNTLTPGHTLAVWIRLMPPATTQDILYANAWDRRAGLRLEDGRLTFHVPGPEDQTVSYPFTRWNEYVHIAAVADPASGRARLYENGRLMAEGPIAGVSFPKHNLQFGGGRWYSMRAPLHAHLDETVIWNRALSDREIQSIARRRGSALSHLAPVQHRLFRVARGWQEGLRKTLRYLDYFDPRLFPGRAHTAAIPDLHLVLSKRDRRHFNHHHFLSRQSGRRTRDAARFRQIELIADGQAQPGELALQGRDTAYGTSPRRSFLLETSQPIWNGLNRVRLTPPEDTGGLAPLLDARLARALGLPEPAIGWCRLFINGRFEGIYVFEDDSRRAVDSHAAPAFLRGPDNPGDWPFVFTLPFQDSPAPRGPPRRQIPLPPESLSAMVKELLEEARALLPHDVQAPFSRREWSQHLQHLPGMLESRWNIDPGISPAQAAADYLTPFRVLGDNPAPLFVREDLDLNAFAPPGVAISWSSSHPEVITAAGQVQLPDSGRPVSASLVAQIGDGTNTLMRELTFRVMPRSLRVPALMMYVDDALQKSRRVDARFERYARSPFVPEFFRAFQGERGGVKFRGNTSFWQAHHRPAGMDHAQRKLSMSIRMDQPHRWLNDSATRHLYLGNGYIDVALLRNSLSYALFQAAGTSDTPRNAPDLEWTEVFVNGQYYGLFELGTRVDRHMLDWDSPDSPEPDGPVLYKFVGRGNNFAEPNPGAMAQKLPSLETGTHHQPYLDLVDGVTTTAQDEFSERIDAQVDLDAILDWHLLLNLTENRDGINVNFYLAGHPAAGQRLFLIPWDYDKTFARQPHAWYSNALTSRLWRDHPDYASRLASRWSSLRQGPWSDSAILEHIDGVERQLAGYIEWDLDLWNQRYARGRAFSEVVSSVRERALERLAYLDRFLSETGPPNEAEDVTVDQDEPEDDP